MTPERIVEISEMYEAALRRSKIQPKEVDKELLAPDMAKALSHVMHMMPKVREFVAEGRKDKAERWLCWAQGILWFCGFYNISDQMGHNRTPEHVVTPR